MLLIYMFLLTSCYIKMVKTFSNTKSFKILSDFKLKKKGGTHHSLGRKQNKPQIAIAKALSILCYNLMSKKEKKNNLYLLIRFPLTLI